MTDLGIWMPTVSVHFIDILQKISGKVFESRNAFFQNAAPSPTPWNENTPLRVQFLKLPDLDSNQDDWY